MTSDRPVTPWLLLVAREKSVFYNWLTNGRWRLLDDTRMNLVEKRYTVLHLENIVVIALVASRLPWSPVV